MNLSEQAIDNAMTVYRYFSTESETTRFFDFCLQYYKVPFCLIIRVLLHDDLHNHLWMDAPYLKYICSY